MCKSLLFHPAPFEQPSKYNLNQSPNTTNYANGLESFHTPFTQYAKPRQPEHWYEPMHHSGMNHATWQENQNLNQPYEGYSHSGYGQPIHENIDYLSSHANIPQYQQPNVESPHLQSNNHLQPNYSQGTPPKQPGNLLTQFQNAEGQLDVDKMLNTVGQLANTYHQVAPIVKQFSSFMKTFRS